MKIKEWLLIILNGPYFLPVKNNFLIMLAMVLQFVKLHRDMCLPLASKLAESICFHPPLWNKKQQHKNIGFRVHDYRDSQNLLTFQKIAMVKGCSHKMQFCFPPQIFRVSTPNFINSIVLNYHCHSPQ